MLYRRPRGQFPHQAIRLGSDHLAGGLLLDNTRDLLAHVGQLPDLWRVVLVHMQHDEPVVTQLDDIAVVSLLQHLLGKSRRLQGRIGEQAVGLVTRDGFAASYSKVKFPGWPRKVLGVKNQVLELFDGEQQIHPSLGELQLLLQSGTQLLKRGRAALLAFGHQHQVRTRIGFDRCRHLVYRQLGDHFFHFRGERVPTGKAQVTAIGSGADIVGKLLCHRAKIGAGRQFLPGKRDALLQSVLVLVFPGLKQDV